MDSSFRMKMGGMGQNKQQVGRWLIKLVCQRRFLIALVFNQP
jgi:hypothetical protein